MGPLLFLIYVNDIPEQVECNISMFADDTKIYTAECCQNYYRFSEASSWFKLIGEVDWWLATYVDLT